jgi:hypothetical protein
LQAHPGAPFLSKSGSLPLVVHRRAFTTQAPSRNGLQVRT